MNSVMILVGILCVLYYFMVILYAGRQSVFAPFWLILGTICLTSKIWLGILTGLPGWILGVFGVCVLVAGIAFLCVECFILQGMRRKSVPELSYLIVLGARVNGTVPCRSLLRRIDTAAAYLRAHPDMKAVLSGGQGPEEAVSEAFAMKQALLERGIGEERLLLEDRSRDTRQNMLYSQAFFDIHQDSIGVVTNSFHIFRSLRLGKKQGYQHLYGLPAPSDKILMVNYLTREFFAVVKDKLAGNI